MILLAKNVFFPGLKLLKCLLLTVVLLVLAACDISGENASEMLGNASGEEDKKPILAPPDHPQKVGSIDQLLDGLMQRLETDPDDVDGWLLLAKSYQYLGQTEQAKKALSRAQSLGYEGADIGVSAASNAQVMRDSQVQAEQSSRFFHEPIYQAMEDIVSEPAKAD